jgi:hypothetical protein
MTSTIDLHDAEIHGIEFEKMTRTLSLSIGLVGGRRAIVRFPDARGWDLGPFAEQNILFEVRVYQRVPDHLTDDVSPQMRELVASGAYKCFELDPSVGLGGYVIAVDMAVE